MRDGNLLIEIFTGYRYFCSALFLVLDKHLKLKTFLTGKDQYINSAFS